MCQRLPHHFPKKLCAPFIINKLTLMIIYLKNNIIFKIFTFIADFKHKCKYFKNIILMCWWQHAFVYSIKYLYKLVAEEKCEKFKCHYLKRVVNIVNAKILQPLLFCFRHVNMLWIKQRLTGVNKSILNLILYYLQILENKSYLLTTE